MISVILKYCLYLISINLNVLGASLTWSYQHKILRINFDIKKKKKEYTKVSTDITKDK